MNKTKLEKAANTIFVISRYLAVALMFKLFQKYTGIDTEYPMFYIMLLCLIGYLVISTISFIQLRKNKKH